MFQSICFSFPSLLLFFLEGVKSGGEERDRECGRVGGGGTGGIFGSALQPSQCHMSAVTGTTKTKGWI